MSSTPSFDFEKLVPGFEFLKNIGKSHSSGGLSSASSWIAPTLDPKELDKKIQELKTVQFWLDQNTKAIGATIQALEVQKMTLSTLRGMNFSMNDLSDSLKANVNAWQHSMSESSKESQSSKTGKRKYSFTNPDRSDDEAATQSSTGPKSKSSDTKSSAAVDPAEWWNSLGEQFQHIAQKTVQEMQKHAQNNQHLHGKKEGAMSSTVRKASAQPKKPSKPVKAPSSKTTQIKTKRKPINQKGTSQ